MRSVQVFLRRPLERVRTVVLDPASRAAQALTRIVLPSRTADTPQFVALEPGEDPRAAAQRLEADAWLAIGDAALRQALAPDAPPAFSPSAAWTQDTGLPFVFAVWILRPGLELACASAVAGWACAAPRPSRSWLVPPRRLEPRREARACGAAARSPTASGPETRRALRRGAQGS